MSTSEKQALLDSARATQRYQPQPRPPPVRPTRALNLSISVLILVFFALWSQNPFRSTDAVYHAGGQALPHTYAICSREGKRVYTVPVEGGVGAVECVVAKGKEVLDTGSLARVRRKYGDSDARISPSDASDLKSKGKGLKVFYLPPGHSMTPGLVDAHAHPLQYGHTRQLLLQGSRTVAEAVSRVEDFVRTNYTSLPAGTWVEGLGWDQNLWPTKEFPTAADLNTPVLRDLPITLSRVDIHAQWVSPKILELLGPLPDTVVGGQIVRDSAGVPTGVFLDNAMNLIEEIRPPWTDKQRETFLHRVTQDALAKGLTGVHDASVGVEDHRFYKTMADQGKLGLRFYQMAFCEGDKLYCGDDFDRVDDGRLTVKAVKLFADGALGSRGAAMIEDYNDQSGWSGFLLKPEEVWKPLIREWYEKGWQVNVHCIGDLANKVVLDAIEEAVKDEPREKYERRFRLEHAQIMRPEDIKRAGRLGVIGSYQPTHATSDMRYAEDRIGSTRIKGAYAWQTYKHAGGRLCLGSDFPVESIDPLKGFYAAVFRCAEDGSSPHGPDGWFPDQKLSREEALRGMTVDAAWASFSNDTGSLTPGRRFDAVVWDDDLMNADKGEVLDVQVKATLMDGKVVFGQLRA